MSLYETVLGARGALYTWVEAHPYDDSDPAANAQRGDVADAAARLSQVLVSLEGMGLQSALDSLEEDSQTLDDTAQRISGIASSIDEVTKVVADVDTVVGIVQKVITRGF